MKTLEKIKNHPAADVWPMMDAKRYDELLDDVREHGQREPITLCDGMILDGRNRYRACVELEVEPFTRLYNGDPWALSWSLNGARRDLEDVRRALIKLRCDEESEKIRSAAIAAEGRRKKSEAAKGMPYAGKGGSRNEKVVDHNDPPPSGRAHAGGEPGPKTVTDHNDPPVSRPCRRGAGDRGRWPPRRTPPNGDVQAGRLLGR